MWDSDNTFLNGPYAPWREDGEAFGLEIEGELPAELAGALFHTSASQHFRPVDPARHHWFDGDGMVYGIYLRDGRATFRTRYVATTELKLEIEQGRALFRSAINGGQGPEDAPPGIPPMKNPANTNAVLFDDRVLVFCADFPYALRPDTLETVGKYDFKGGLPEPGPGPFPLTPHFKIDPDNGDMLTFVAMNDELTWYRVDKHGNVLATHKVDLGFPTFLHDYTVTEDYATFLVNPTMVRFDNAMKGQPSTMWEPETLGASRFAVLNRHTGKVQWIEADGPFTQTHFLNGYQEGTKLVIDGHRTEKLGTTWAEIRDAGLHGGDWNKWFTDMVATPWRWELDLETGRMTDRQLTDVLGEFPRINDQRAGRPHRYGYYAATRGANRWFTDGLVKQDLVQDRTELQALDGVLTSPNEPVFAPREGAAAEDDGWLLSTWYDPTADRSEVVVLHAQDFSGTPVARIKLNHRVPLGFHGNWAPAEDLDHAVRQYQS